MSEFKTAFTIALIVLGVAISYEHPLLGSPFILFGVALIWHSQNRRKNSVKPASSDLSEH